MKLYHASRDGFLHHSGITSSAPKTCCRFDDGYVYLGSLEYLEDQYFKYCPKGVYYIYEVFITMEIDLEYLDNVNHYRCPHDIDAKYVSPFGVRVVK